MRTPALATLITGAVVGLGALAALVASEWPELSPMTIGILMTVATTGLVLVPSPLQKGPPS